MCACVSIELGHKSLPRYVKLMTHDTTGQWAASLLVWLIKIKENLLQAGGSMALSLPVRQDGEMAQWILLLSSSMLLKPIPHGPEAWTLQKNRLPWLPVGAVTVK